MQPRQLPLFNQQQDRPFNYPFPSTRYQGSKRKLVEWIWNNVCQLEFQTVLDVFGGTGVVSHMFKNAGKQVTYNDLLAFNHTIGLALIENYDVTIGDSDLELIFNHDPNIDYPDVIERNFQNIYFTDDENRWLDRVVHNINHTLDESHKRALAYFSLFQSCIIKRPYNLFHRANLYMRTAKVERTFGNKTTWNTPFETHFRAFVDEANHAVFDNGQRNIALKVDALETPTGADLVYIDPPYLNAKGTGVDYRDFYHFLEGMVDYENWQDNIDYNSKHRRLIPEKSPWTDSATIAEVFEQLIARHSESILVISYRDDGVPSKEQLLRIVGKYKSRIYEAALPTQYVLSSKKLHELLLVAT